MGRGGVCGFVKRGSGCERREGDTKNNNLLLGESRKCMFYLLLKPVHSCNTKMKWKLTSFPGWRVGCGNFVVRRIISKNH